MDLQLVEVKTGRVGGGHLKLPGLLSYYQNTPMEQAIMKMTMAATQSLAESLDPELKSQREKRELEALLP